MTDAATSAHPAEQLVDDAIEAVADELRDVRRDLHAHPELSWAEHRTTDLLGQYVDELGWKVTRLSRSGFVADLGSGPTTVALRADLDALPVQDTTEDPWRSTVAAVAHACGHDVHATALLGAAHGLTAAHAHGGLDGRVRLLFQPAEEVMPGGATELVSSGHLDDVDLAFALHCDPSIDVGTVGHREGPITGAADAVTITLRGRGGHTSRPHLTQDLTFALGKVITEVPAVVSRRCDPRAGISVVWGMVSSGVATNVIPDTGRVAGTVRMLDVLSWSHAEELIRTAVEQVVAPYGVEVELDYHRGVPPVVNRQTAAHVLAGAIDAVVGPENRHPTSQSLGGEDFGWIAEQVTSAMGRLGTRTPGGPTYDLHQGNLRIDERAVAVGARVLAHAALGGLRRGADAPTRITAR